MTISPDAVHPWYSTVVPDNRHQQPQARDPALTTMDRRMQFISPNHLDLRDGPFDPQVRLR